MQLVQANGPEIDVVAAVNAEQRTRPGRPWVVINMVASIDGATAVDGVSGGLGGPGDKAMFGAIRSLPDVILVGASTAREERYNPPLTPRPDAADHRRARDQSPRPRLCVLTGSLRLEADLPFLDDDPAPLVATTKESATAADSELLDRVELLETGDDLTVERVVDALGALGARIVLCEGGPSLNAQMLAADLVDEICLTLSPLAAAGTSRRIAQGAPIEVPTSFTLDRTFTEDDFLFLRYLRVGS